VSLENKEQARWFAQELQPHEAMLRIWLMSRFSERCEVDDIIQEAFVRVLRVHTAGGVRSPKALLFVTARNLALMQIRHRHVERADSLADIDASGILDASEDVRDQISRTQELELLTQAIQSLPKRCRQVVTLRRVYGLSQREVAAELGITEHTVEIQSAIGLRKIGRYFARLRPAADR
jgi:RNA polymerase sigma-70 factor (ECF subfamily)